ncbi:hypothetical protein Cantr_04080 [Candida viswanathii]|uniref:Uncharacterized protein n=1 Tax=Candida viswanathii TaxID=5486 RepID=A0A367XL18_9ASCO|nr:hypothetical protein Cantr_04080 [Candida viswanathii]
MLQRGVFNYNAVSMSRKRFLSTPPQPPQPPVPPQPPKISPHSVFYRQFAKPFTKICVISIGTYYGLIYLWEHLDKEARERETKST